MVLTAALSSYSHIQSETFLDKIILSRSIFSCLVGAMQHHPDLFDHPQSFWTNSSDLETLLTGCVVFDSLIKYLVSDDKRC